jgi:hypothetical protein
MDAIGTDQGLIRALRVAGIRIEQPPALRSLHLQQAREVVKQYGG